LRRRVFSQFSPNQLAKSIIAITLSPHWRGWLKPENRCLVPANSFSEYGPELNPETNNKDVEDRPLFTFAGIWTESAATEAPSRSRSPALTSSTRS
jgi:putative SOS response-associated peptidase YedK